MEMTDATKALLIDDAGEAPKSGKRRRTPRKPGEGSIEPLPSGSFRARLPLADGTRLELGTHATYEDAEGVLAFAIKEARKGHMLMTAGGVTLRGYGTRYMDGLERGDYGLYVESRKARSVWDNWISKAPFADWPIKRIGHKPVQKWLDRICKKHGEHSDSWFKFTLSIVRKIFAGAVKDEILEESPMKALEMPKREARTVEAWTYLTHDEQQRLFACEAIPIRVRLWLAIMIGTGMRGGEMCYLHWTDVHLDGDAPHVVIRYGARTKAGKLRAPKGRKIRKIPLLPIAANAFAQWRQIAHEWAPQNPLGLVFPAKRGGFQRVGAWENWETNLAKAGITRHVRPHDLRHTAGAALISGMWGEPWRLEEVRDFLGHAAIKETERYAHLAPGALARAAKRTQWAPFNDPTTIPRDLQTAIIHGSCGSNDRESENPTQIEKARALIPRNGIGVGSDLAARLLAAAAARQDCTELAEALASEVLSSEPVRLARKVLAADGHDAVTRAIELAQLLVLDARAEARGDGTHG